MPLLPLKLMAQSPRHDWAISFKSGKGILSWINLGITTVSGCTFTSPLWVTDSGYTKVYSNRYAFSALKADGSIKAWGDSNYGGSGAPSTGVYTKADLVE
jgi:hypothetical protein